MSCPQTNNRRGLNRSIGIILLAEQYPYKSLYNISFLFFSWISLFEIMTSVAGAGK